MTPPLAPLTEHFLNRELSLLAFNERVLAMAEDPLVPALERLKFICIVSSNLDELFEIRVSGIKAQLRSNPDQLHPDGYSATTTYKAVCERAKALIDRQYKVLNNQIFPLLKQHGIHFHLATTLNDAQRDWAHQYFSQEVLPVLTPIGLSPTHPFPRVLNKSLNFIVELEGEDSFGRQSGVAIVQAPRALPRLVAMPKKISGYTHGFMMLSSFVQSFVHELFPGMKTLGVHQFRVTRNSDLFVDDEEVTDLREALQGELSQRQFGDAVRLEVSEGISDRMLKLLRNEFGLNDSDCYRVHGPVNMVRLMQLPDLVDEPELKFSGFTPRYPKAFESSNFFEVLRAQDVLVHHPYDSFSSVSDFIRTAAQDPQVVAIKQTIYRTGQTSELMESLLSAVRAGKEVTVVVELMARFDEETNINWASRLEEAGAHVVFGVVGNKTHAKMSLMVRREKGGMRRYAHLGTGNYHPRTARTYTDFGLFTSHKDICADVHEVFQQLTGLGHAKPLKVLWQSPFTLHERVREAIEREARHAKAGKPARIIAKMNSLVEPQIIEALYKASQTGVKIDLIVRGVCVLRPRAPGLSENISVRSTIGRFLEHSRVFYFKNGGKDDVYLSSADWMDRNFFRRVELAFPILDPKLKQRVIREGLMVHLRDNALSWSMRADGTYAIRRITGTRRRASQELLMPQGAA
ncbi:MAG: polyphosphate kinase 1 [Burkholderiaceae bacterium]|jgi:polyphosphate kinase|nr:polyphosphate kinase 1 [Burkholderiaceae bacterium]